MNEQQQQPDAPDDLEAAQSSPAQAPAAAPKAKAKQAQPAGVGKRGPGRPRIHPIQPKRPRGRPRKHPLPPPAPVPEIKLVSELEMAAAINMSVSWLRKDRLGPRLIPFVQIGPNVRYEPPEVLKALAAMRRGGFANKAG